MIPNFEYVCLAIERVIVARRSRGAMDSDIVEYLTGLKDTWNKEPEMVKFLDGIINGMENMYFI